MKPQTLKQKIAAYVTLAGAYMAAHPVEADAQIMYTDVNPDLVISNSFFNLDLNNDGVVDFVLHHASSIYSQGFYYSNHHQAKAICIWPNKLMGNCYDTFQGAPIGPYPSNLQYGEVVSGLQSFAANSIMHRSFFNSSGNTSFSYFYGGCVFGIDRFLGVKVVTGGIINYGWVRLSVYADSIVLKDYAINTIPDSSILVGVGGCVSNTYNTTPNGNQFICNGDSFTVTLHNSAGENIQWMQNGNWQNGQIDSTIIINQSGTYQALVFDSACSVIVNAVVLDSIQLHLSVSAANETCQASNAHIDLTINGNSPPYVFQWNNGATTEDLNSIPAGSYDVTVTENVCGLIDTLTVNIINTGIHPNPTITQNGDTLETQQFYSILWYLNGVYIPSALNPQYLPTQSGIYTVHAWDSTGCQGNSSPFQYIAIGMADIEYPFIKISVTDKKLAFHLGENELVGSQIDIINELGQCVRTLTVTALNQTEDLSALPAGVYFYHLRSRQKTYSGKFIIE